MRSTRVTRTSHRRASRAFAGITLMCAVGLFAAGCGEHADPQRDATTPALSVRFKANSGFVVPVSIAGKTYNFLVDTGASFTFIDNGLAQSITRHASDDQIPIVFRKSILEKGLGTADGVLAPERIQLWQPLPIRLGNYEVSGNYPWIGHDLSLASEAAGIRLDGIVGMEIFRQLTWLADNRSGILTVWRQPPAGERFAHCVPYEDSFGRAPGVRVDFHDDWMIFMFDTGATHSIVSGPTLANLANHKAVTSLGDVMSSTVTAGGRSQLSDHFVNKLLFDDQPIGSLRVNQGNENMLGMNFLERFDRYMFVPSTMEFCYDASHFTQDEPQPLRDIAIRFINGHVELFYNEPKQLGRYGLENGDVLVEINGKRVEAAAIEDARGQLSTTPAGSLNMTIERNGLRRTVKI
ncbi:aspartyl protease family protein [Burkholderia sp. 22PA0106]|uniref:aspartyl protease family protein n=1 Tax=Burkholderia sp. 22PA0106 TaxID=3237371 RepID=UPI0039C4D576